MESLQSHAFIHSSIHPFASVMRDPGSIPRGYLGETGILLSALSRYSTYIFRLVKRDRTGHWNWLSLVPMKSLRNVGTILHLNFDWFLPFGPKLSLV